MARRGGSGRLAANPLIAGILVGAAVLVNAPYIAGWFSRGSLRQIPFISDSTPPVAAERRAPPTPAGIMSLFPVGLEEEIEDPFLHEEEQGSKIPRTEVGSRPPEGRDELPLQMIMKAGRIRRAVIAGRIVREGASIGGYVVERIEEDRVVLRREGGDGEENVLLLGGAEARPKR